MFWKRLNLKIQLNFNYKLSEKANGEDLAFDHIIIIIYIL